ncbi:MAG: sodium:proton antiporter [Candidatus Riflebacteria bacterium]|nr:sodium:proton antiporter [Candidatus Riflebacteria bacterium]
MDVLWQTLDHLREPLFRLYTIASTHIMANLATIMLLGLSAQWLGWWLHIPSILLLLSFGFLAGPVTGLINPDQLLGNLLNPLVSLSVGIILFEGGLNLKLSDLPRIGRVVRTLNTIGVMATWTLATLAAHLLLPLSFPVCLLFGAILTVTGPTVILPLLRQIKPNPRVSSILRWEGILVDPVGATLAVLVFEVVLIGSFTEIPQMMLWDLGKVVVWGSVFGAGGALLIFLFLRHHLAPEYLHNPLTFALVVGIFAFANQWQAESGLLAVTLAGILLGSQTAVSVRHILKFKENLQVLLISTLFILLAARMKMADFQALDWRIGLFLALLIFVVRPAAVFLATLGSDLSWQERTFLAFLAPRGIVAASVASIFSLQLTHAGNLTAHLLVPYTFAVIVTTVLWYGLTAGFLARHLGISQRNPQGTIIVGAHDWAREIARQLAAMEIPVLLIDKNRQHIEASQDLALPVLEKSVLSEDLSEEIELTSYRRLICLTANDTVNSLANLHFQEFFEREDIFQLPLQNPGSIPGHLCGRTLFGPEFTFEQVGRLFNRGAGFRVFSLAEWQSLSKPAAGGALPFPLFAADGQGSLTIATPNASPVTARTTRVLAMVSPDDAAGPAAMDPVRI